MGVCSALLDLSSAMEISCGSNVRPQLQWGSKRRRNPTATAATITATTTTCVTQQHQGEEEEDDDDRTDEGDNGVASSAIQQAEANTNRKPKGIRKKKACNELKAVTAGLLAEQEELNSARVLYEQLKAQKHALKTEECSPMNERLHRHVESEGSFQPHAAIEPNSTLSQLTVIDHLPGRHRTHDSCAVESRLLLVHLGITSSGTKGLKAIPSTISYGSFRSNEMNIVGMEVMNRAAIAAQARKRRIEINRLNGIKCIKARPRSVCHSVLC